MLAEIGVNMASELSADDYMALDDETFSFVWRDLVARGGDSFHGHQTCRERYVRLNPRPNRTNGADRGAIYLDQLIAERDAALPNSRIMDLAELSKRKPPAREWIIPQWLSWAPTLLSGRGGVGKSLMSLQLAYSLASASGVFGQAYASSDPLRVLVWACEDDHDEVWRRLDNISIALGVPLDSVPNLIVDARKGLESELYTSEYGRGMWTSNRELLRQQIGDYKADVVILDNIAHLYSAGENNRPAVTAFVNGIIGLCMDRRFCPILLGHPAKAEGSEFSGSTAWENAVRMRWFLSDKLPDQKREDIDEEAPADSMRYLSKRKTNYTVLDYLQMSIVDGAFKTLSGDVNDCGTMAGLRIMRCKSIILASIKKINDAGFVCSDSYGLNYLPKQIISRGWAEGNTKGELHKAMMLLIGEGVVKKQKVGVDSVYRPRYGLVIV